MSITACRSISNPQLTWCRRSHCSSRLTSCFWSPSLTLEMVLHLIQFTTKRTLNGGAMSVLLTLSRPSTCQRRSVPLMQARAAVARKLLPPSSSCPTAKRLSASARCASRLLREMSLITWLRSWARKSSKSASRLSFLPLTRLAAVWSKRDLQSR